MISYILKLFPITIFLIFCKSILLPWLGDYTHMWTDEDLYKYFNLTPEEIAIIEDEIK